MVTPYKNQSTGKKEQVATMFNNIANRYDFLNNLLSLGIHKSWRKKTIHLLKNKKAAQILDVATGTADFAIEALKLNPTKVTGIDISEGMLSYGKEKIKKLELENKIELLLADSENIPFPDNTFDIVTVGFGVRNFEQLGKGLQEIHRILKPSGTLAVLEFSKPKKFPIKQFYYFYFNNITPWMGKLFSKDNAAYTYLPESVKAFPDGDEFILAMNKVGFQDTHYQTLSFGIATIYIGSK